MFSSLKYYQCLPNKQFSRYGTGAVLVFCSMLAFLYCFDTMGMQIVRPAARSLTSISNARKHSKCMSGHISGDWTTQEAT